MSLADELRKAIESKTDPREIQQHLRDGTESLALLIKGREQENARLKPVLMAMIDVCAELELFEFADFNHSSEPVKTKLYEALTRLRQAVEVCK